MMEPHVIRNKINDYEQYIEGHLKQDLKEIEDVLNGKAEKYKHWEEVKQACKTVDEFKQKDRDMHVRMDIGNNVVATCQVTEYEQVFVCVGLGYMLEMDTKEANKYADIRLRLLKKEIDHYRKLAVNVKVHIKLVLLAISELQTSIIDNSIISSK